MSKTETPDIVERLLMHGGKADIEEVLADCREAAAEIERLRESAKGQLVVVRHAQRLREEAEAEAGRLRSELAKHQWRTMDSAPRDGIYVLVWRPDEGDGYHEAHIWIDCYLDSSWYHSRRYQQPTHWQPLPSPPGENDG